jgi:RNA polymerase sigma-70 factor (ECF subfamily)
MQHLVGMDVSPAAGLEPLAEPLATSTGRVVRAAMAGDVGAFETLLAARLERTHRIAQAVLGSALDAGDATQEAWLSAWRQLPRLRDPERFDAWLDHIVVNACRMQARGRRRLREVSLPDDFDPQMGGPGPEQLAERHLLEAAFGRLDIDQRTILVLHDLEQRPLADIAEVLHIPVGTAKSRLHVARAALERALEGERRRPRPSPTRPSR